MAKGRSCCCKCVLSVLIVLGLGLLVSGIIVAVLRSFTSLADDEIKKNLPLKEGSTSFKNWQKPEGDLFLKYYFFNTTNLKDIILKGDKPEVNEVGPYTYRRKSTTNVTKRAGQTITYDPRTEYLYDKSRSCAGCDPIKDIVTTVNYPFLVVLRGIQLTAFRNKNASEASTIAKGFASAFQAMKIEFFQLRSVDEFLWGYEDKHFAQAVLAITKNQVPNKYALQFNNTGSGVSKIHTGEHDVDRVAEYLEWNNMEVLPWWNSDSANMINGTGGTRFKPFIEKDDELYVLVTEICRSLKLTYDGTVNIHGIDLYRFTPPKEVFVIGDINPDNKGFCVTGRNKACIPSGLLDVNACKGGIMRAPPFVASTPNFYFGDPRLAQEFNLTPNKEKHATFVDIEPNTGLAMQGHRRLQLNFALPRHLDVEKMLLNVNASDVLYFPSFYSDESARISEEDADDFKKSVLLPLRVAKAMPYVMIGLGALLLIIAVIILVVRHRSGRKSKSNGELGTENYSM